MKKFTISPTIRLDTQAKAMVAAGQDVINLTAGELDFEPTDDLRTYTVMGIAQPGNNRYSAVAGQVATKQAVVDYEQRQHAVTYQLDQIVITNGAKQALFELFQVLVASGDEVLVLQPGWVSYIEQIKIAGGVPIRVQTTDQFLPDLSALQQAITPRTVGLVLNYPNNPTGVVYNRDQLQALAAFAKQHHLWVISDEIYEHILYVGQFTSFASLYDRTIVVNGISKAGAVTGWRVGYAAGPTEVMTEMTNLQSQLTGNVSNVMQAAMGPSLQAGVSADWLDALKTRRQLVVDWVAQHPKLALVAPAGAFYCFIDIRQLQPNSVTWCEQALQQCQVALVPGVFFGRDGFVRLSFANQTDLIRSALQRLEKLVV